MLEPQMGRGGSNETAVLKNQKESKGVGFTPGTGERSGLASEKMKRDSVEEKKGAGLVGRAHDARHVLFSGKNGGGVIGVKQLPHDSPRILGI